MNIDPSSPYHSGHRSVLGTDHPDKNPEVSIPEECVTRQVSAMTRQVSANDAVEGSQRMKADVIPEDRRSYRDVLMG
jgi:hypothetical protein